jgi:hypothetical protein
MNYPVQPGALAGFNLGMNEGSQSRRRSLPVRVRFVARGGRS